MGPLEEQLALRKATSPLTHGAISPVLLVIEDFAAEKVALNKGQHANIFLKGSGFFKIKFYKEGLLGYVDSIYNLLY